MKERTYTNIHFPFQLSDKYLLGADPYNPFKGEYSYLYRSHLISDTYSCSYEKHWMRRINVLSFFPKLLREDLCLPDSKKFDIWDKIGSSHFLLCYDRSEKISKDECMCVVYWELKDPKGFKKTLKEVSSCPEKVDEMIVDIDSE